MPPVHTNGKKPTAKELTSQPSSGRPKLTNRGGAGLHTKVTEEQKKQLPTVALSEAAQDPFKLKGCKKKPAIHNALKSLIIGIDKLTPDPNNARVHPDRNMASIILSLYTFGQTKPIVVRKQTMVVVAGNGTLAAAKQLGWSQIAASVIEMTEGEAAAYGLADNRTAELAKWDMETVARLDKLAQEFNIDMPGWSVDELEVLRAAEWVQPSVDPNASFSGSPSETENDPLLISFDADEYEVVGPAIARMRLIQENAELSQAGALKLIVQEWLEQDVAREQGLSEEG